MGNDKWHLVEGVTTAIEQSLATVPGTKVVPNAMVPPRGPGKRRQVDVLVEIPIGSRQMRIGVEVRDKRTPLDVTQIEQPGAKLTKLALDRGCVVASSGFTEEARVEAVRYGLELRTLAEVAAPNWWLPTAMLIVRRGVELVGWQLNYPSERLDEVKTALAGVNPGTLQLTTPPSAPVSLKAFVASQGVSAVGRPDLRPLRHEERFTVIIKMQMPEGSFVSYPDGKVPVPDSIAAVYVLNLNNESVPLRAYQLGDSVNAFSGVSSADGKQLTIVTKAQEDGQRRISVSIADAKPSRTPIDRITDDFHRASAKSPKRRRKR